MRKISHRAGILILLEGIVVVSFMWCMVRDLRRSNGLETTVVGSVFACSVLALLLLSLFFRKAAPLCAQLGWLILFGVLLVAVFSPRL